MTAGPLLDELRAVIQTGVETLEKLTTALGVSAARMKPGERRYARMVVDQYATHHTELPVHADIRDQLPLLIAGMVEPLAVPSVANVFAIAQAAITPNTRLVVLANPNNPTGTIFRGADLAAFMKKVPDHVLVILDEAYFEYATAAESFALVADELRTSSLALGASRPGTKTRTRSLVRSPHRFSDWSS
jgi:hypothetical protein